MKRKRYTDDQIAYALRQDYNRVRSHSSLGGVPPEEYAALQELRPPTAVSAPAEETRDGPRLTL